MKRIILLFILLLTFASIYCSGMKKQKQFSGPYEPNPRFQPLTPFTFTPSVIGYKERSLEQDSARPQVESCQSLFADLQNWVHLTKEQAVAEIAAKNGIEVNDQQSDQWMNQTCYGHKKYPFTKPHYLIDNGAKYLVLVHIDKESDTLERVKLAMIAYKIPLADSTQIINTMWSAYNDMCRLKCRKIMLDHRHTRVSSIFDEQTSRRFHIDGYFDLDGGYKEYTLLSAWRRWFNTRRSYHEVAMNNLRKKQFFTNIKGFQYDRSYELSMRIEGDQMVINLSVNAYCAASLDEQYEEIIKERNSFFNKFSR